MADQAGFAPHRLEGTAYRLISPLGGGAVGDVFLGEHDELRRRVVIKLIKAKYIDNQRVVGRLKREARIVSRLKHASLVTIYDLGVAADGRTFIAMEHLEGVDLRRLLHARGRLKVEEASRLMLGVLDGLEAAHQAGVIHRDIKPENIFVPSAGGVKLLDFGVARPQDGESTNILTAVGFVVGTPKYMAPEQAFGKTVTAATDVYACGAVLFESIAGDSLFPGRDVHQVLQHHITTPAPTLAARTGERFDRRIEAVIARALKKEPGDRFARAADMAVALRRALGPSPEPRESVSTRVRRTITAVVLFLALGTMIAFLVVLTSKKRATSTKVNEAASGAGVEAPASTAASAFPR